ncbi:hypothetical protein KI387_011973, partial [Taxus chinensis]
KDDIGRVVSCSSLLKEQVLPLWQFSEVSFINTKGKGRIQIALLNFSTFKLDARYAIVFPNLLM